MEQDIQTAKNTSFEELLNCQEFHKTINPKTSITQAELVLMTLKFALGNNLCHSGFSQLSQIFNISLGQNILPQTRHMLDQTFNDIINVEYHALCHYCSLYLGEMETATKFSNCPHCDAKLELLNPSSVNYFIVIDPSVSIRNLLEENQDYYHYVVNERESQENHIKDIFDGYCYRSFLQKLTDEERSQYLTVNINTDGAPRFESSTYSIWPIYIMPNEVPLKQRRPIVAGLWFGKHKPNMIPFLLPFTQSMNKLSADGIACTIRNRELKIKLFVVTVVVDAVARAPMQGLKQFNGYYSCNWCEQEGTYENGVRYPYLEVQAPCRTADSLRRDMEEVIANGTCRKGVQSLSPLIACKNFDIVEGFVADYLHAELEGAGPQFTEILVKYLTPDELAAIDHILVNIKAPNQICRLSRKLSERAQWKAREWENWILYYSLPIFTLFLQNRHPEKVEHWSYFVKSLHILLGDDITLDDLNEANDMLHKFVKYIQKIYKCLGLRPMTFNVHQLLHMARSVYNWGPLHVHSTFIFESGNMQVLQAIKCAKGAIQQVARFINLQYCLSVLETKVYPTASASVKDYCDMKNVQKTFSLSLEGPTYFGTPRIIGQSMLQKFNLSRKYSRAFSKMVKCGCLYNTSKKDNDRSCNYYAQLTDGRFIKIYLFVIDEEQEEEYTIYNAIETENFLSMNNPIKIVENTSAEFNKVYTKNIRTVCIFQKIGQMEYICPIPNLYHY